MKLTKKWEKEPYFGYYKATWNNIQLVWSGLDLGWIGRAQVYLGENICMRSGLARSSRSLAQKDAEKLAMELASDLKDGAKMVMKRFGNGENYE